MAILSRFPGDGEPSEYEDDDYHNKFNYRQNFSSALKRRRISLIEEFIKNFKVLDLSGKIYSGTMIVNIDFPLTWVPIMELLYKSLFPHRDKILIEQIKEKFGGLRVYYVLEGCGEDEKREIDSIVTFCEGMVEGLYLGSRATKDE